MNSALSPASRNGRAGLTLVEVLLAVAIMSAGLAVLLTGLTRCLGTISRAKTYQEVSWVLDKALVEYPTLATNDIEELEVSPVEIEKGYTFSREIDDDDDEDELYVLTTRVEWEERGRRAREELVQYVHWVKPEKP